MNKHIIENVEYGIGDEVQAKDGSATYYFTINEIDSDGFISKGMYIYMRLNLAQKRYPQIQIGDGFFPFTDYNFTLMRRKE